MRTLTRVVWPMAAVGMLIAAWILMSTGDPARAQVDVPHALVAQTSAAQGINLRRTTTVEVVDRTKDAVVYIASRKMMSTRVNPFGNNPFFSQFDQIQNQPINSLGSGFVIHPDGYIVTNNHVVDKARQITVTFLNGTKKDAELISADPDSDLAILKVDADKPLPTIELGDSSDLMIGEPVIAVGNPLGLSHSVSTGIVSAIHRDLKIAEDRPMMGDLIQTDAAINFGNSGGPLLNAYGQVIGINTAIRGDAQNIGFSIPINHLRDLIPDLMSPGSVNKLDMKLKLKEVRKLTPPATVESYVETADAGGRILSIAGHKPHDIIDAYAILLAQDVNKPFTVELDGQKPMKVTPVALPPPDALVRAKDVLGLSVEQVTPMVAQKLGLPDELEDGIFIHAVEANSPADRAGLKAGDVLMQIGPYRVSTLNNLGYLIQQLPKGRRIAIAIIRDGSIWRGNLVL